jgi:hypothetical protein
MNGKPGYFLQIVLILILLVLTIKVAVDVFWPVGRYAQFRGDGATVVGIVDTRTGKLYINTGEAKGVIDVVKQAQQARATGQERK